MVRTLDDDELGCARGAVRTESRRLVEAGHAAVIRSQAARSAACLDGPLARRERLLAVKAREVAQIERAIQFYVDMAQYWRDRGMPAMADKLDARTRAERERLALAFAERDAWPPVA
jgi:hypothetical protein